MGALKPLLEIGGRTLLERAVGTFTSVDVHDVVVVTGHRGDDVGAEAERLGARVVFNPRFDTGMYSSVQVGVAALRPDVQRFFLLPVDCPLVRPETVGHLARVGAKLATDVVLPTHRGVPGHPPLLHESLRVEILASQPSGGLQSLLDGRREQSATLEVDDSGVSLDADTAADLVRLDEAASAESLPGEERCHEILRERAVSAAVIAHSRTVAAVAAALAIALNERGQHLCLPLIVAAALLHDVARGEARHAEAGAALIESLGYARVAAPIRRHMDLRTEASGDFGEAAVLYLADKLVLGDQIVGLDERFVARARQMAGDPAALAGVESRKAAALAACRCVEEVLGHRLEFVHTAGMAVGESD
jgi:molybdenum cofactor cytidylyltransferase